MAAGDRVVVALRRGDDLWYVDVPDAATKKAAEEQALRHANGYFDTTMNVAVPPSNGPAGWVVDSTSARLPHEEP